MWKVNQPILVNLYEEMNKKTCFWCRFVLGTPVNYKNLMTVTSILLFYSLYDHFNTSWLPNNFNNVKDLKEESTQEKALMPNVCNIGRPTHIILDAPSLCGIIHFLHYRCIHECFSSRTQTPTDSAPYLMAIRMALLSNSVDTPSSNSGQTRGCTYDTIFSCSLLGCNICFIP